jgi:carbamoyltransferase
MKKSEVVKHLIDGKIVAIFQGKSEWGPRALGNRSILFDPRNPNAKDIINKVKKREWYRPFAGTVMLEHVNDYFEMATIKESPYMSFAVPAKQKAIKEVPGIIHVDGTCRIQTVTRQQNKNFYNLIKEFYKQTGVPILFNTSFNLAGEPLVETIEDAIDTMDRSDIDILYTPDNV